MRCRFFEAKAWLLSAALCVSAVPPRLAHAAPKAKPGRAAPSKPNKKIPKPVESDSTALEESAKAGAASKDDKALVKGEPSPLKTAGSSAAKAALNPAAGAAVKETKETKEGVKTYKFGTIEVESRLKSPQIIYFLRRVRAEFDAGLLGHRSFMRELSDTRNNPSLR